MPPSVVDAVRDDWDSPPGELVVVVLLFQIAALHCSVVSAEVRARQGVETFDNFRNERGRGLPVLHKPAVWHFTEPAHATEIPHSFGRGHRGEKHARNSENGVLEPDTG